MDNVYQNRIMSYKEPVWSDVPTPMRCSFVVQCIPNPLAVPCL